MREGRVAAFGTFLKPHVPLRGNGKLQVEGIK